MADIEMLSSLNGVSGNEESVRKYIEKMCGMEKMSVDAIGNLYVYIQGRQKGKTALVTTHMDEAGFIVSKITEKGFIKFQAVGNIDPRNIVSKKVSIGTNGVKGIIGMKAIHLQKKSERENTVNIKDLFIDIGAKSQKQAGELVKSGDYISFDTEAGVLGDLYKGKAMDRVCAGCVADVICTKPVYDTVYVFTAQKHVGSRGAKAITVDADIVLNVGAVEAADMFKTEPYEKTAKVGGGVVVGYADRLSIADREFADKLYAAAEERLIPVQRKGTAFGQGISGAVQTGFGGRKTASIEVPVRYMNTPVSLVSAEDALATTRLLKTFLENMGDFTDEITE